MDRRDETARGALRALALILLPGLVSAAPAAGAKSAPQKIHAASEVRVLAGDGLAWRIRPSLEGPGAGLDAGAWLGLLANASGHPADVVAGDPVPTGLASLFGLSVEVLGTSGSVQRIPYAPAAPAEYDPERRVVEFPEAAAGGLRMSRTIRISRDGRAGAWLSRFANDSAAPLTVLATLSAEPDSAAPAAWVRSSGGNAFPDPGDEWAVTASPSGSGALGLVLGGSGGRAFLAEVRTDAMGAAMRPKPGSAAAAFTYQLRLEPGESGILLNLALLGDSVDEAASRAARPFGESRTEGLLTAREKPLVLNADPRRLASCCDGECELYEAKFLEPAGGTVVNGVFRVWTRTWAASYGQFSVESQSLSGQYKGVDASGSVVVWYSRLLDDHAFSRGELLQPFLPKDWDYTAERKLDLDSAAFTGGFGTDRRLEAIVEGFCRPFRVFSYLPLVDGSSCLTHVDIISPAAGALIDQPVSVAVQPYCQGTATLEILAGETSLLKQTVQKASARMAPDRVYFLLDPATIKAGTKKLKAVITDSSGCSETEEIEIAIPNNPPTLTVASPRAGDVVYGQVPVRFQAADDRRLERFDLYVDGVLAAGADLSGTAWDSSLDWDSCGQANGVHALRAVVTDWDGATAAQTLSVEIRNVLIGLTADRREAQQKSLVELSFTYQNPGPAAIAGFAVWRKAEGDEYKRVSVIPFASAANGTGSWADMPGKMGGVAYKIEALDAGGRAIGRSTEVIL